MAVTETAAQNQLTKTVDASSAPPPRLHRAMICVAYLYLMRVPFLVGASLVLLPILAMTQLQPLLQNLFILGFRGTIWTTATALALCWSILLTSRLVRLNGVRFGLPQALHINTLQPSSAFPIWLLALPLILVQFLRRDEFGLDNNAIRWRLTGVIMGAIIAYLFAFVGVFLTTLAAPPDNSPKDPRLDNTFPAPGPLRSLLKFAHRHGIEKSKLDPQSAESKLTWLGALGARWKRLPKRLWIGYLDPKDGLLWSGHWLALSFAGVIGVLTFVLAVSFHLGEFLGVPALCYLLILLLNLNWILSFLAFFFDRYRVPLLIPIAAVCFLGAGSPLSDHYFSSQDYDSKSQKSSGAITPADVLAARRGKPVILVATAGGGIQAGAWTDQVLSGLETLSNDWKTPYRFHECLTLVSSVSGGATGSMYFLNLYGPDANATFHGENLTSMQNAVELSSLDDIGWALALRDFTRLFLPYGNYFSNNKLLDRGDMLEQTWRKRGNINAALSDWRVGVKEGFRPAVIFNSTIAETGGPLLLSTTDLPEDKLPPKAHTFYDLYKNKDLPVVTAVRLAATFPYVTPAARIVLDNGDPAYHMIDGGYYDNPGISSLVTWLDTGLQALEIQAENNNPPGSSNQNNPIDPLPEHILIIQIRSFPDETKEPQPKNRGWFFQALAPIDGLLNVRTSAQLIRDRRELEGLARIWRTSDLQGSLRDRIRFATFTFDGTGAPLSWAMSKNQKDAIAAGWNNRSQNNDRDLRWVHCTLDPAFSACNTSELNGPY